jgi:putative Mn2+ efflux pump MntP
MIIDLISIILVAIALAMDSFSVSLTKGYTQEDLKISNILWYGAISGFFEALMPLIGYLCGTQLTHIVSEVAPWLAFILLLLIGLNMIRETISNKEEEVKNEISLKEMILLSIATSIDAFAVGITLGILNASIWIPILIIGIVSFILTVIGALIGKKLGDFFGDKFQIAGGIILILIGLKILLGV